MVIRGTVEKIKFLIRILLPVWSVTSWLQLLLKRILITSKFHLTLPR